MTETIPLVQAIRDRFELEDQRPIFSDPAITSGIAIDSTADSYKIVVYPRLEYGYEGFAFSAQVPEGIFGEAPPTRIETTFDNAGVMKFEAAGKEVVSEPDENGVSFVSQEIRIGPPQNREGLILPGDPGFELFEQLQAELAALKAPVADAMATLGVSIDPQTLYLYEPQKHGASYSYDSNHNRQTTTLNRATRVSASSENCMIYTVDLDASVRYPEEALKAGLIKKEEDPPMVYQSGTAYSWRRGEGMVNLPKLGIESLAAFSGLYAVVRRLYRNG